MSALRLTMRRRKALSPRLSLKHSIIVPCPYQREINCAEQMEEIQLGDVMAHVVVRVGENLIESVITRRSADELKLKKGDTVAAVVKATEVMIQKD
jgi:molybdopterin-binding protein